MSEAAEQIEFSQSRRFRPYAEYKDSGVEWLGEIPAHWKVSRLRTTVIGCQNGVWGDEPDEVHDVICVRVADFDRVRFRVKLDDPTMRSVDPRTALIRRLEEENLLLEKSGGGDKQPVGAVVMYDHSEPAVCSNFVALMPVADGHHPRYLTYLHAALYAGRINVRSVKQSTGIQNLDSESYLNESVGVPSGSEQRAIADFLDRETAKIDALVAKKERLIELLQEKRAALITRAVTRGLDPNIPMKDSGFEWLSEIPAHWGVKRLKNVSTFVTSGSRGWAEFYSEEGPLFLRIGNVQSGSIDLDIDDIQHVDPPRGSEGERTRVKPGDVLVSITALIGAVAVVSEDLPEAFVNQHLALIRLSTSEVDSRWIAYCVMSPVGQTQFAADLYGGTKDGLGLDDIRSLVVLAPPFREQERIVTYLDSQSAKLMKLVQAVRTAIFHLKEFRTALISAAVTGKIDVREAMPG